MINTVSIKIDQLSPKRFLTIGSGNDVILIIGSCRIVPYVNYFNEWNIANGNRFTIHTLDPFNHNWNDKDERVDYIEALKKLETDDTLLTMLKSVNIFIHEWYQNAAIFNCDKKADDGIYSFGLNPQIDICIPNYNDRFVLFGDIVTFDTEMRKKAMQDMNVIGELSEQTQKEIFEISQQNLNKFYQICRLSDIPEMEQYFKDNFRRKRFFWTQNHVSKEFTYFIFVKLCKKFLGIDLSEQFLRQIYQMPDMFANNYTKLSNVDIEMYGFEWGEEIKSIKQTLFG